MYLKKLELNGFKSFASKTVLDFLPTSSASRRIRTGKPDASLESRGITAIVGPNGSGKSNIADAIRWAIGEQSLKNLRGKKSEDVIFSGTDQKTRLGSASVTLFFDNADKRLPIEFAEVSITRKIYRNGESEYLVNGSRVRLMDIVDLLAKAGIGKDSYCVINQGMSDALLQATPAERRSIFEDAAGVKQYQIEKERSLRKLESTKENLDRVDSLVLEIAPHLKNLKRQVEKASQGKDIAERLRGKQLLLYGALWYTFQGERKTLSVERARLESEITALEKIAQELQKKVTAASSAMETHEKEDHLEKELETIREALNAASREMSIFEGKREIELEREREREEIEVIPVDLKFIQVRLEEIGTLQKELLGKLDQVERIEELQEVKEFATVIRTRLAELKAQAGDGTVREKKSLFLSPEEQKAHTERKKEIEKTLERLKTETLKYEGELVKKTDELSEVRSMGKTERETFFRDEALAREKERELGKKKDELNELKVRLARIEVREEDLTTLVREELSMKPESLVYDGTSIEREKLEREIARLKVEVEHVGTIDPLIVEEYEETEKRYTFLTTESNDLRQAIQSLQKVIKEMDEKIDVAFKDAFREIAKKFSEYFRIIFGGGKAELNIVKIKARQRESEEELGDEALDEENELAAHPEAFEIGIDIVASPPGKRIHNLSMLSGGERSLTSLALLFAVIAHNPPPFAVLDEVEAALDEANSRRFGKMLQELSLHTQFIAITHNRETMSQAGLLYGVTMGDDGLSRLLSIRLDQDFDELSRVVGEEGKLKPESAPR